MNQPLQPIDDAVRELLANTQAVETDPTYRPILASSLAVLGYSESETVAALDRLYSRTRIN